MPLIIALLFTVFSGAIRKWGVNSSLVGNIILALQLLIPLYFWFKLKDYDPGTHLSVAGNYKNYMILLVFLALHPLNETLFHGLFGFLLHSAIWVMLIAYLKIRKYFSLEQLDTIIWIILIIEITISGLQYYLPGNHILNIYSNKEENTAIIGNAIRASGTFSYLGGLQGFMVFWGFFSWYSLIRNKNITITIAVLITGFACALFTGSRSVMANYMGLVIAGLISTRFLFNYSSKLISVAMLILIVGLIVPKLSISKILEKPLANFEERFERGEKSGEMDKRVESQFFGAFNYHGNNGIFGVGLGSTYQGAIAIFGKSQEVSNYGYLEDEAERIVVEGGFLLYIFRLFIFFAFLHALMIPRWTKFLIFILFSNALLTFNIYMGIFFALGLIWVDRAYYLQSNPTNELT